MDDVTGRMQAAKVIEAQWFEHTLDLIAAWVSRSAIVALVICEAALMTGHYPN